MFRDQLAQTGVREALGRLAALDERKARIMVMRHFGGLSREEIAEATGMSLASVVHKRLGAHASRETVPLGPAAGTLPAVLYADTPCDP